jgi:Ca2+-binding EF-hand superfamily protein
VSTRELVVVMRSIGLHPSLEEIQRMMNEIIPGNNGNIGLDGFMELLAKKIKETEVDDELKEAFKTFDRGGKGYYTLDDLRAMVYQYGERMSEDEIKKMFAEQDVNKNRQITYDEFVKIVRANF